jgi:hypothetical protein
MRGSAPRGLRLFHLSVFTNHLSRSFLCPAFVSGSLIGATAAKLPDFGTPKDSGNARWNRSFGVDKVPSDGPEFH